MKRILLLGLASTSLAACYGGDREQSGQCPAGETCSPLTPSGLFFIGRALVDDLEVTGPAPTAIGGTQDIALQYTRSDGVLIALDLPFQADDGGGGEVAVDHTTGSTVTVKGVGHGSNYLRIVDANTGELFDRKELSAEPIDDIALIPSDLESYPVDADLAWMTGAQDVGIALTGEDRLVDTSMQLALDGATQTAWDTLSLANAQVGTHSIAIVAAGHASTQDLVVVDHADTASAYDAPSTIAPQGSAIVCFSAQAASRYVVGLDWTFTVDGVELTQLDGPTNCVGVSTQKLTGSVVVVASAGGQQATVTLAVTTQHAVAPGHHTGRMTISRPTAAGERARM